MGNHIYKSENTRLRIHSENVPPPRPIKPSHLQGSPLPSLPTHPSDPRAFLLPPDNNVLQFNPSSSPGNLPEPSSPLESTIYETGVYEYVDITDIQSSAMPLSELVEEYGNQLPLRFRVSESLYGVCEEGSLMEGQLLNVLFEKRTKVMKIEATNGPTYSVPLNTLLQFGILYNPQNKLESAKKGYIFPKVSDLISASPSPPRAVAVTKSFEYKSANSTWQILEGQILILGDVIRDSENEKTTLQCTHLKTGLTLMLDESMHGDFSTSTHLLKIPLEDIMKNLELPVSVVLERTSDLKIHLPLHATVDTYTIVDEDVEKSVIVSSKFGKDYELVEILLTVPIEAQLVNASDHQLHVLRQESEPVFKTFHPSKLSRIIVDTNSSINYIQTMLFKVVPSDNSWMNGTELIPPQPPSTSFLVNMEDEDDAEDYIDMSLTPSSSLHETALSFQPVSTISTHRSSPKPVHAIPITPVASTLPTSSLTHSSSDNNFGASTTHLDPIPYMVVKSGSDGKLTHEAPYEYVKFSSSQKDHQAESQQMQTLQQKLIVLQSENTLLTSQIQQMQDRPTGPVYDTLSDYRNMISSYTSQKITRMLDFFGLGQYKEKFLREQINGELFLMLTDEILEKEIEMKLKIHRIKVMRIVNGKQSLADFNLHEEQQNN